MAQIFFSYSHKDEQIRDQLAVHLAALERQGMVNSWHDRRIVAGTFLGAEIDEHLESADIVLCLVSPDYIASDYCYSREMHRALERHQSGGARVIPVILRYCEWEQTPLGKLRGTPRDNKPIMAWQDRDEAFNDVAKDIRRALGELGKVPTAKDVGPKDKSSRNVAAIAKPRSSNLHVRRAYTDLDRDNFIGEAFEFLAEFFANSIHELKVRHDLVDGRFSRVDANRFTVSVYKQGKKVSGMTVFRGGMHGFGSAISFNLSDSGETNSSNGGFTVVEGDQSLWFHSSHFGFGRRDKHENLDANMVAEALWGQLLEPLQR